MKRKTWIVSFISIMIISNLLCGCGVRETSSKVETKVEESKSEETEVKESKVEESKVEESKSEANAVKESKSEENEDEKAIFLLSKKTEYLRNGSEDVIYEITEYEYNDLVLSKETTYNASGEVQRYSEYMYQGGELLRVDDYIRTADRQRMYRWTEHTYEDGKKIKETYFGSGGGAEDVWEYQYDSQGNMIYKQSSSPLFNNKITSREELYYNEFGGMVETITYSQRGTCIGHCRYKYDYNEQHKPIEKYEILSDGSHYFREGYKYDDNGNLVEFYVGDKKGDTYGAGSKIVYEYNENNELVKECKYQHSYGEDTLKGWIEYEYEVHTLIQDWK